MNIFIGSSREASEVMDWVAECLERHGHNPMRWDNPGLFPPGENTFLRLIEISKTIDGAIFIFAEDDKVWYRGDGAYQPRDNVLIEYGLFAGQLGPGKAIIAMHKSPKQAADLLGMTYVDVSDARRERARFELRIWASNLQSEKIDPAMLQLMAKLSEQDKKVQSLEQKLSFEAEKNEELETLLTHNRIVNLQDYDLSTDGHWKLLFEFDYFWPVALEIARDFVSQRELYDGSVSKGGKVIADMISWDRNDDRTPFAARKALRLIRKEFRIEMYKDFVNTTSPDLKKALENIAHDVLSKKNIGGRT